MTAAEALVIVKRKAIYAFQTQFGTVMTDAIAGVIIAEHSRTEKVADVDGVFTDTTIYDTTGAAIEVLETVAPFAPQSKSIGGISVTYETIQQTIKRLQASVFVPGELGRYPRQTSALDPLDDTTTAI